MVRRRVMECAGSNTHNHSQPAIVCGMAGTSSRRAEVDMDGMTDSSWKRSAVRLIPGCSIAMAMLLHALFIGVADGQLSLFDVQGQFRGGSISWEPVDSNSNLVRFTVTTAWLRSAGTYVQVVDGVPRPQRGYQPVKGHIVNIMGYETPKFMTYGVEKYLQVRVTSSTEQVGNRSTIGQGLPHTIASESYWANNWFEGVSEYVVEFPRRDVTYVAELQGCCRQSDMCRGDSACLALLSQGTGQNQNNRDGVGIKQFYNTPFFLSTTVRLDMDPPPISFIPHYVPFVQTENGVPVDFELAVLDFLSVRQTASTRLVPQIAETWAEKVIREEQEQAGSLVDSISKSPAGRRLANFEFQQSNMMSLDAYPPPPVPAAVAITAGVTGTDVRQLNNPAMNIKVYSSSGCAGADMVEVPPNMDVCDGSLAPQQYPSGGPVKANVSSYMVPSGMAVEISDRCEFSLPPENYTRGFSSGNVVGSCDNRLGTRPMCCNVAAGQPTVMFRAMMQPSNVPTALRSMGNNWIQISHRPQPDGRVKVNLRAVEVTTINSQGDPVKSSMDDGNYVIRLKIGTNTSCTATIEFILHLMTTTSYRMSPNFAVSNNPIMMPTGFESVLSYNLIPSTFQDSDKTFFDNVQPQLFGRNSPGPPPRSPPSPPAGLVTSVKKWERSWVPCLDSVGLYFYCVYGLSAVSPFVWSTTSCTFVRVVQDLPPKIAIFDPTDPNTDRDSYNLRMGETKSVMVRAVDNPSDAIDFLGISKVDLVTGDRLRAKVEYVYDQQGGPLSQLHALGWPRLVEPDLPMYLMLTAKAPTLNNSLGMIASQNTYIMEREMVFRPSRQHSGLTVQVCFLAVDMRGQCKNIGSGTTRCLMLSVQRCKYAMTPGQSLLDIAGMFATNWLQLYALNPLNYKPDVPVMNTTIVNVGHIYKFEEGDTLNSVMVKFGTDLDHIRLLNADLSRQRESWWSTSLQVGYEVCIIPDSCGTDV